jgi:hypothetical protein
MSFVGDKLSSSFLGSEGVLKPPGGYVGIGVLLGIFSGGNHV